MQPNTAPTRSLWTLERWSARWDWAARQAGYDAAVTEREKQALEAVRVARRKELLDDGLARVEERVARLVRLADFLEAEIFTEGKDADGQTTYPNLWLQDVKSVGFPAERVDIERFNTPLVAQYRATLADIAAEVGGRSRTPDGTPGEELPVKAYQGVDFSRV